MATNPITIPRARPVQPVETVEVPVQPTDSHLIEWKDSRNQAEDLQRGTVVHVMIVRGRPDQAALDASLGGLAVGYPHPYAPDSYVVHVRFEHYSHGPDPDSDEQTPTTQRDSQNYTKMTVTYRQIPCPAKWEEQGGVSLISRLEWYDRKDPPRTLRNTREGVSILIPQPTYKRHFPKVFLSATKYNEIEDEVGRVNGRTWHGRKPGHWLLEGWLPKLLYGDPTGRAAYELTLMWRGDPERHHEWWFPKIEQGTLRPIEPNAGETRDRFLRRAFDRRTIYEPSEENWDELVPLRRTPCDPPATTS